MKRFTICLFVLCMALLSACATSKPAAEQAGTVPSLLVSGGEISKSFTRADLEALPASQAVFKDVTYSGVTVTALIEAAGFDPAAVKAVKAVASDGYTVNYDVGQVLVDEVIVAYSQVDAELPTEDGSFRMVLPNAEGKLNLRQLVELQIIQ